MSEIGRVGDPELELEQILRRIDPAVAEAQAPRLPSRNGQRPEREACNRSEE